MASTSSKRSLPSNLLLLVIACLTISYAINSHFLFKNSSQHELHYLHSKEQDSMRHPEKHGEMTELANEAAYPLTDDACAGVDYCLALREACRRLEYCITIHVFAYRRADATRRLLEALASSNYTSYAKMSLPLVIHVDKPQEIQYRSLADVKGEEYKWSEYSQVKDLVQGFDDWPHGPLILNFHPDHKGLRQSWLEAWPNPRPNDIMVAFEDDTLPSPLYFEWLLKILREYDLWDAIKRDDRLLGVSLSPIRYDEISFPTRPWMAYEKFTPAKFPFLLHALPSSWGAVYFGNQWREFLDFVLLRGQPPFYNVTCEINVKFDTPHYAWGTRYGDPNLWLPKGSTINGWSKSWKRFMVDFAYGRGAYMLYPNFPNATGLATSLFLSGEHFATSAVRNQREAPLIEDNGEMRELFNNRFPSLKSLPLMDLHCEDIDRVVHAQRGDAFVDRIAALGSKYKALAHTWRRPCMLRDQRSRSSGSGPDYSRPRRQSYDLVPRRQYIVMLPSAIESPGTIQTTSLRSHEDSADILARQLIDIAEAAMWSKQLGRTLVLPYLTTGRRKEDKNDLQSIKNDWVPFDNLFYPDDSLLKTVLPDIDYVFADLETLRDWYPPNHIALIERVGGVVPAHNQSLASLHKDYLGALGWSHVPQVTINLDNHGMDGEIKEDGIYAALGSCTDEVLGLGIGRLGPARDLGQRQQLLSVWKALFHPARVVEHMVNQVKAQMKYHYDCLRLPLAREFNISTLGAPNLLVVSSSVSTESNPIGSFEGKQLLAKPDIDRIVGDQLPNTHPHATSALMWAAATLVEMTICVEAGQVSPTKKDPLKQTAVDFVTLLFRKEENLFN